MSSSLAESRSWAELLDLEVPSQEVEAFEGLVSNQSDEQDIYLHDTIPAPPPDGAEDPAVDTD